MIQNSEDVSLNLFSANTEIVSIYCRVSLIVFVRIVSMTDFSRLYMERNWLIYVLFSDSRLCSQNIINEYSRFWRHRKFHVDEYIYIYIYIYMERESFIYIYIYIYMLSCQSRELIYYIYDYWCIYSLYRYEIDQIISIWCYKINIIIDRMYIEKLISLVWIRSLCYIDDVLLLMNDRLSHYCFWNLSDSPVFFTLSRKIRCSFVAVY